MQENLHVILIHVNMVENVLRQKIVALYVIVKEHFIEGRLLVIIDDIGILDYVFFLSTSISIKSDPNANVIVYTVNNDHCASGGINIGTFGLLPCPFTLKNPVNLFCLNLPSGLYFFQLIFNSILIISEIMK